MLRRQSRFELAFSRCHRHRVQIKTDFATESDIQRNQQIFSACTQRNDTNQQGKRWKNTWKSSENKRKREETEKKPLTQTVAEVETAVVWRLLHEFDDLLDRVAFWGKNSPRCEKRCIKDHFVHAPLQVAQDCVVKRLRIVTEIACAREYTRAQRQKDSETTEGQREKHTCVKNGAEGALKEKHYRSRTVMRVDCRDCHAVSAESDERGLIEHERDNVLCANRGKQVADQCSCDLAAIYFAA